MNDRTIMVTNIQRMCFHDGPGIRTTVFLKGCSIRCPWCSNPENLDPQPQTYERNGERGVYGQEYTCNDLVREVTKDRVFWGNDGGVTFSGGEALLQADALREVLKGLKEMGIHLAVETALFVNHHHLERVLPYVDYFIVDAKIMDKEICREVLGGDIEAYRFNLDMLYREGKLKLIRIPCNHEYTMNRSNALLLVDALSKYKDIPIQIFGIHNLGESKYQSIGEKMWEHQEVKEDDIKKFRHYFMGHGFNAEIVSI